MVKPKETLVQHLARWAKVERQVGWVILRGEWKCHGVALGALGSLLDFGKGKILNLHHWKRLANIAEFGLGELVGGRPCGQHRGIWILAHDLPDSLLVKSNDVGVSQIVFGREAIGGIEAQAGQESDRS